MLGKYACAVGAATVVSIAVASPTLAVDPPYPPSPTPSPTQSVPSKITGGNPPNNGEHNTVTIALIGGSVAVLGGAAFFVARRREKTLSEHGK